MLYSTFCQVLHSSLRPNSRIVLALSGGVDSRVMLQLLAQYRHQFPDRECCAVHIHHGLSRNADLWLARCQQWCQEVDIAFYGQRVELALDDGESIEQLARDARYDVLQQYIHADDVLLTGQHSGDQLETFLLALKRGSGPKGLSAMAQVMPFAKGYLVRPFLRIKRRDIEGYANQQQLSWNEDESNQDQRYERNFLRHSVAPLLTQRWPSFEASVQRSAELCAEQQTLLDELLGQQLQTATYRDDSLEIAYLAEQSELARNQLIRMWLAQKQTRMPSRVQLQLIWQEVALSQQDANPKLQLADGEIRRFQGRLYWLAELAEVGDWQAELSLNQRCELPANLGALALNSDTPKSQSQRLRAPYPHEKVWVHFEPQGLVAHPSERAHSRKLKKLFQEYGVPSWLRRQLPILMYGDNVAAVGDLFVCRDYCGQECELIWYK